MLLAPRQNTPLLFHALENEFTPLSCYRKRALFVQ